VFRLCFSGLVKLRDTERSERVCRNLLACFSQGAAYLSEASVLLLCPVTSLRRACPRPSLAAVAERLGSELSQANSRVVSSGCLGRLIQELERRPFANSESDEPFGVSGELFYFQTAAIGVNP